MFVRTNAVERDLCFITNKQTNKKHEEDERAKINIEKCYNLFF